MILVTGQLNMLCSPTPTHQLEIPNSRLVKCATFIVCIGT